MVLNLIFSYSGRFFILLVPAFAFCDLGSVAGALVLLLKEIEMVITWDDLDVGRVGCLPGAEADTNLILRSPDVSLKVATDYRSFWNR